jgi:hypothetical protein
MQIQTYMYTLYVYVCRYCHICTFCMCMYAGCMCLSYTIIHTHNMKFKACVCMSMYCMYVCCMLVHIMCISSAYCMYVVHVVCIFCIKKSYSGDTGKIQAIHTIHTYNIYQTYIHHTYTHDRQNIHIHTVRTMCSLNAYVYVFIFNAYVQFAAGYGIATSPLSGENPGKKKFF